jgi:hypothetical protein
VRYTSVLHNLSNRAVRVRTPPKIRILFIRLSAEEIYEPTFSSSSAYALLVEDFFLSICLYHIIFEMCGAAFRWTRNNCDRFFEDSSLQMLLNAYLTNVVLRDVHCLREVLKGAFAKTDETFLHRIKARLKALP